MTTRPSRKKLRMENYDYFCPGHYFITICIHNRENLLGRIVDGSFVEYDNEPGKMIIGDLLALETKFSNVKIHDRVCMPNHIHFILEITNQSSKNLNDFIKEFKRSSEVKYRKAVKAGLFTPYKGRFWQKNYYDRVIRNDKEMYEIQKYIRDNPLKWELDELYREDCL